MKLFLLSLMVIFLTTCHAYQSETQVAETPSVALAATVSYTIKQEFVLVNDGPAKPEKHNLWVALLGNRPPYQEILSRDIQPKNYSVITDEYGNQYAEFDFMDLEPDSSVHVSIIYHVNINELVYTLAECNGEMPDVFNYPELHIESNNPQIVALAGKLSAPDSTICEQVRSFYDYIGDNLLYAYNGHNWGAQAALGRMGADCTEYSSLLIALSRASGIPARYVEGLLYLEEGNTKEVRQEHAWVEVYLPSTGWVSIDPTLGRSPFTREQHFTSYSPNHIIVTSGRSPSTLRGASYWSHLYWPGESTNIRVQRADWNISPQIVAK